MRIERTGVFIHNNLLNDADVQLFSLNENIHGQPLTEDEIQDQLDKINDDKTRVDVEKELESIIAEVKTELAGESYSSNYDKVSAEALAVVDKINSKFIPEMCEALHRENPRWKASRIKNQVASSLLDFYPGIVHSKHLLEWTIQPKTKKLSRDGPNE